jgi:hydroxymethylpyrimidine/phosphomethylpyrimidine kinase
MLINDAIPVCLTVAGSDSGGGAGIQADLKTFEALGVYGASALTALTAQNTTGVRGVVAVDPAFVRLQIDAVCDDLPVGVAKTGMLANAAIIQTVAEAFSSRPGIRLVVDPVVVARSGDLLLEPEALDALRTRLLPLASVLTPNRHEAALLTETGPITDADALRAAARSLFDRIGRPVLAKGGSALPGALDVLIDADGTEWPLTALDAPIATRSTHGTGCTLSAALAAGLALGMNLVDAAVGAKRYVTGAIRHAPGLGAGHGPVDHGWMRRSRMPHSSGSVSDAV